MTSRSLTFTPGRILVLTLLLASSLHAGTKQIRLRNETIATAPPSPLRKQAAEPRASGLYLIQFRDRFQPGWRQALRVQGVELLRFVPDDAFIARFRSVDLDQLRALPSIQWVGPYRVEHKLHASLLRVLRAPLAGQAPAARVRLLLAASTAPEELVAVRRLLGRVGLESRSRFGTVVEADAVPAGLSALAQSPSVLWIEPAPQMRLFDEVAARIVAGDPDNPDAPGTFVHELGYDGRGVVAAVADSGLNDGDPESMHPDLAGRVDAFYFYGALEDAADEHSHGTHVAGIIAGNGATGETDAFGALYGLGVAPRARIVAQRIFDGEGGYEPPPTFETLTRDAVRAGAVIGSNSWGDDTHGRYDLNAHEFDALVRDADALAPGDQPYILEFSAGNAGPGPQTIGSPAVAKNVIATGAVENNRFDFFIYADGQETMADFSSRGPCEDGRIKPDIVAPGTWIASLQSSSATDENAWSPISLYYQYQGGTSQSGPHASGAAAVFVQYYRETHTNATPSPALVKAALINSAADMDNDVDTDPAPNHDEGWGRVDLVRLLADDFAYEFLDQSIPLVTGQVYERRLIVASDDLPLRITLAYTDVPGMPAALPALVNDLDLEVIGPDGSVFHGNQFSAGESAANAPSFDTVNNVEGVHLTEPVPGEYLVRIHARNVAEDALADTEPVDQDFALIISGDLPGPDEAVVFLDRNAYTVPGEIRVRLIDPGLGLATTATVLVTSGTESQGESVILRSAGPAGVFSGLITTATGPAAADGILQIQHGDPIEVVYENIVQGEVSQDTAVADLVPPVISGVSTTNRFGSTLVLFRTDERASAIVRFGTNGALSRAITNTTHRTEQTLTLSELLPGVEYQFTVTAIDQAGNQTTQDNQGQFYRFVAAPAPLVLLVNGSQPSVLDQEIPIESYTGPLDQIGVSYEIWDIAGLGRAPTTNDLRPFRVVIWRINDAVGSDTTVNATDQANLETYLEGGGSLLIASMEILTRLGDVPFRTNVLHVESFEEDAGVPSVEGSDNDPISNGILLDLDYSAYDNDVLEFLGIDPDLADPIVPTAVAAPILFDSSSGAVAGIRFPRTGQDSPGRVVFLPFPLEAVPEAGDVPNTRAGLLRRVLSFLAAGAGGLSTIALDRTEYTLPSLVTVEVADLDLAGQTFVTVRLFSQTHTNGLTVVLGETVTRGVFRGGLTLVDSTNAPALGQLRARDGELIRAEYRDASPSGVLLRVFAGVDTGVPTIRNVAIEPEYEEATVTWETSEFTDALVQFGESTFLGRTGYRAEFSDRHQVVLRGLVPDRLYYYQVVSRDPAGNVALDNNGGQFHTFRTRRPIQPPWTDSLEGNSHTNWAVLDGDFSQVTWRLGKPNNGLENEAFSPPNAWGSNLSGDPIDTADTLLVSPAIDLTAGNPNRATLRFWHSYDFTERSEFDIYEFGQVYVSTSNSAEWTLLAEYGDISFGWEEAEIDLSPYLGHVVRLGWYYKLFAFDGVPRPGWLIDDISVTVSNIVPGILRVTNNLSQATFALAGPVSRLGQGTELVISNAPAGQYTIAFGEVPFYQTPPSQTNVLAQGGAVLFEGAYTFADANNNAIADAWEQEFFGAVSPERDRQSDTDQDGATDYAEFIAGTSPTNAASKLTLELTVFPASATSRMTWPSAVGRGYRVDASTNAAAWFPVSDWIRARSTITSHTVTNLAPGPTYLFRLEVRP